MKHDHEKHIFACYIPDINFIDQSDSSGHVIHNESLVHRLKTVLRLDQGAYCIFFDRTHHALVQIQEFKGKQTVVVERIEFNQNPQYEPSITVLLALLKRDALENALYNAVELAVNHIILVHTAKAHRQDLTSKDLSRLNQIMIAAAEQSKCYRFAQLHGPFLLSDAIQKTVRDQSALLILDPRGTPTNTFLPSLESNKHIILAAGPEGGFTDQEYQLLVSSSGQPCALTPTILRSFQATTIAVGLIRSWHNKQNIPLSK